jgi:hypothetical protein
MAFKAGKAFVNGGATSGLGKSFQPIKVTSRKTTTVNTHIPILIPLYSVNFGVFGSNV